MAEQGWGRRKGTPIMVSTDTRTNHLPDILASLPERTESPACNRPRTASLKGPEAVEVAERLGLDVAAAPFTVDDLQLGLDVELELRGACSPSMLDLLDDDLVELGKTVVANLCERADYYTRLIQAHAPGDPPSRQRWYAEVGTD
jgi:hypothetical protein